MTDLIDRSIYFHRDSFVNKLLLLQRDDSNGECMYDRYHSHLHPIQYMHNLSSGRMLAECDRVPIVIPMWIEGVPSFFILL